MEPIITLPYSEWLVAERLMKRLPSKDGYSVYAPLSRQEKGVDLLVTRRSDSVTRAAALQVKYSRTYEQPANARFRFSTLFHVFPVSERADFVVFASLYPNVTGRGGGKKASWWRSLLLLFGRDEAADMMKSLRTTSGASETKFYFEFNSIDRVTLLPGTVLLTRGAR